MESQQQLVIVGAGAAASELAIQTRQGGWTGSIVMVGDEPHLPYNRPPLSKAWLDTDGDIAALLIRPSSAYEKAGVACRVGWRVTRLDRAAQQVVFDDGSVLPYTRLALCTGGRARPWVTRGLPAGHAPANLHVLRDVTDAQALRAALKPGVRLAVVGAGYVGLEVAASARKAGAQVTVVEAQPRVLMRSTGVQVSAFYASVHREHGVDLCLGSGVSGVERAGGAPQAAITALVLADGRRVACDAVVAGVGMLPRGELAEQAGLATEGGALLVDACSRTSDPHIVAAGDCTVQDLGDGRHRRLESVPNALEQARAAAAWLNGQVKPNVSVPWFWSDQYGLKLQMVGLSAGHDEVVCRGALTTEGFVAFYLREGVVIAAEAVNRPQDFMLAKRLVAGAARPDVHRLADPGVPLKDLTAPVPAAV